MKIFLAGGSGAIGRRLIPMLIARGHSVTAMTRTPAKAALLQELGAQPVTGDALDPDWLRRTVNAAAPEVVVHQMTAITPTSNLKDLDRQFAPTNRLRVQGTEYLLAAARAAGAKRFVAQSYTGWPNRRSVPGLQTEDEPLEPAPPPNMRRTLEAIQQLEQAVSGATDLNGVALRFGSFYGPGTLLEPGAEVLESIRLRRLPLVGTAAGVWSFIHVDDAASATCQAIEKGAPGIFNIVDDHPAPVSEWVCELARMLGAEPPRRVPAWIARFLIGDTGVLLMTEIRGASNAKAKRILGWQPAWPDWREGFRSLL